MKLIKPISEINSFGKYNKFEKKCQVFDKKAFETPISKMIKIRNNVECEA